MLDLPSTAYTAGHLELIWCHAHTTQPEMKCVEVEHIADWYGDEGKLLDALVECGWLDVVDECTVQVHDYADHAPAYVKKRDYQKKYMQEYRKCKDVLDTVRPNKSNEALVSPMLDVVSVPTIHNHTIHNLTKDNTLLIENEPIQPKKQAKPAQDNTAFDTFWKAYPRKVAKPNALKAWNSKKLNESIDIILASLERWKASRDWTKDGGQFIPHPATWLNREGWNDEVSVNAKMAASAECIRDDDVEDIFGNKNRDEDNDGD
jgi:hypothetical protein